MARAVMRVDNPRWGGEISIQKARQTLNEINNLRIILAEGQFAYIKTLTLHLFGREVVIHNEQEAEAVLEACEPLVLKYKNMHRVVVENLWTCYRNYVRTLMEHNISHEMPDLFRTRINKKNLQDCFDKFDSVPDFDAILSNVNKKKN